MIALAETGMQGAVDGHMDEMVDQEKRGAMDE
jgi:hypothetical protein